MLLAQHHTQAASGRITRDATAVDAGADDQQIADRSGIVS
jgi:hypothetical protein